MGRYKGFSCLNNLNIDGIMSYAYSSQNVGESQYSGDFTPKFYKLCLNFIYQRERSPSYYDRFINTLSRENCLIESDAELNYSGQGMSRPLFTWYSFGFVPNSFI